MLWRRHIRHNQTVRQAVEYCTIYLNPHVGANGCNTCVCITCMRNVYIGMPRSGRSPSKVVSCTFLLHELPAWTASTKYSIHEPSSKEKLLALPHFWSLVCWKRLWLVPIQPVCRRSREGAERPDLKGISTFPPLLVSVPSSHR